MCVCTSPFANVITQWATCKSLVTLGGSFECTVCSKIFNSKQAVSVHRYKVHGIKSIERKYLDTSQCPVCLLELWSRERAINHVKRSRVCNENLLMRPPLLTEDQADVLDECELVKFKALRAKGLRRHAAEKPCVQASGPKWPIIIDPSSFSQHHPLGKGHQKRL